jgi:hypothetical protein
MQHARTMVPTNDSYNHRLCPRALPEHPTAFSVNRQTAAFVCSMPNMEIPPDVPSCAVCIPCPFLSSDRRSLTSSS